jgi:pyruvate/2-oxoacid:ferredoxin oxidoreductase alpha subunit
VIHAGHGEFPRAVFAPGTPEQAFCLTSKAFNLADKYQIPAMILSDQYFSDTYFTAEKFDTSLITVDRGEFFSESDIEKYHQAEKPELDISHGSDRQDLWRAAAGGGRGNEGIWRICMAAPIENAQNKTRIPAASLKQPFP